MKLPDRLARLADYVIPGAVVADIGTDHALLPAYLVQKGICSRVIACDLHPGPLESAKRTVAQYGLDGKVELRRGYGLEPLSPGEASVIVIAGMGGAKIREILAASPAVLEGTERLILQPLGGEALLRRWLLENGWALSDEELVYEGGRFYVILVAESAKGSRTLQRFEDSLLEIGPKLLEKRHPLLVSYLKRLIQGYQDVLRSLERSKGARASAVREDFQKKIDFLKGVMECLSDVKPS
ncbi:MAG: tRNA (adenine(22)-N(1))-methyltransferase [Thermacetogeniaceae bacterium]